MPFICIHAPILSISAIQLGNTLIGTQLFYQPAVTTVPAILGMRTFCNAVSRVNGGRGGQSAIDQLARQLPASKLLGELSLNAPRSASASLS